VEAIQRDDLNESRNLIAAGHGWRPIIDSHGDLHLIGGRYFFPVHLAAGEGRERILQELLCAEVRRELHRRGMQQEVDKMESDLLELLRAGSLPRAGAELDVRDEEGRTPIMWVCSLHDSFDRQKEARQLRCLRLLARAGANLEATNAWYGKTALHQSARHGDAVFVKELISFGANVDARAANGNTPLHEACAAITKEERLAVVRLLVEAGSDPTVKNRDGKTARDIALENGYSDVLTTLEASVKASKKKPQ
jgi:ankyrin repeat protein